jgi:hypothetical protein
MQKWKEEALKHLITKQTCKESRCFKCGGAQGVNGECYSHYLLDPKLDVELNNKDHLKLYRVIYLYENKGQEPPTNWKYQKYMKYFSQVVAEEELQIIYEGGKAPTPLSYFKKGALNGANGDTYCSPECALQDLEDCIASGEWWQPEEGYGD